MSYPKKDLWGPARQSFFVYDNDKDLKVCFLVALWLISAYHGMYQFSLLKYSKSSQKSNKPIWRLHAFNNKCVLIKWKCQDTFAGWFYYCNALISSLSGKGSVNSGRLRIAYCLSVCEYACILSDAHVYRDESSDLSTCKVVSLPPASAVEVIESESCFCVCVCVSVCVSALSQPNRLTYDLEFSYESWAWP